MADEAKGPESKSSSPCCGGGGCGTVPVKAPVVEEKVTVVECCGGGTCGVAPAEAPSKSSSSCCGGGGCGTVQVKAPVIEEKVTGVECCGGGACGVAPAETPKIADNATGGSCCGGRPCSGEDGSCTEPDLIHENVKEYYGKRLTSTNDLETNACMIGDMKAPGIRQLMKNIHPTVLDRFYGCGSPIPPLLDGLTVLDLGCGTGTDVYTIAQLVGEKGKVIGIDMTDEQLAVAREFEDWHRQKFGFEHSNVIFKKAFIEDLKSAGIADESVDVVISNCVVNLAPDKRPVLEEIERILKPGGELYFSDVFVDRRVPKHLRDDKVLFGECLSGALYIKDFGRLMEQVGLGAWGVVSQSIVTVNNEDIQKQVGDITFYSLTVRAIKLPAKAEADEALEDYGQTATYDGGIPGNPEIFDLDIIRAFSADECTPVDALTANMLSSSRYNRSFIISEKGPHRGLFIGNTAVVGGSDCWALLLKSAPATTGNSKSSCCC